MDTLKCSHEIWNVTTDRTRPPKIYFKPNEIFSEEKLKKLIRCSTSDTNGIGLAQIMANEERKISLPSNNAITFRISLAEPKRTQSMISSVESCEFYPPVQVEPICTDTIRINVKVSKAND